MKILKEIVTLSWDYVKAKNPQAIRRDVEDCIATVLGLQRLDLYLNFDRPMQESELQKIREKIKRLSLGEPLQYIEGSVDFCGCTITVTPDVLIPRPETELLVYDVLSELKKRDLKGKVLLDLCSGSGCIGIAIKKAMQDFGVADFTVILSDLSLEAIQVAKKNAQKNNVEVFFLHGDLFGPLTRKVDFLISNPPYIAEYEYKGLDVSVKNFEPKMALVSGESGVEIYERIAKEYKKYVNEVMWLEIGATQGKHVVEIFQKTEPQNVHLAQDLAHHDRVLRVVI